MIEVRAESCVKCGPHLDFLAVRGVNLARSERAVRPRPLPLPLESLRRLLLRQEKSERRSVNGLPLAQGQGFVAATGYLDTGFGYGYYPDLHIGATGWYVMAAQAANPFQLGML